MVCDLEEVSRRETQSRQWLQRIHLRVQMGMKEKMRVGEKVCPGCWSDGPDRNT